MTIDNCGVLEHEEECLCDVQIPHETGWVDCAIQDMWMGQEIVNLFGYEAEWDNETIFAYLENLVFAKDRWVQQGCDVHLNHGQTTQAKLRSEIRERLQSDEHPSIIAVAKDLGLKHDELVKILFMGRRYMTQTELESFEKDTLERKFHSSRSLGKQYNMAFKSAHNLHSYWGVPYGDKQETRPAHEKLIDEILLSIPNIDYKVVAEMVQEQLGLEEMPDPEKIKSRKHYLIRCNRLPKTK